MTLNFDTITARVHFDEVPSNKEIEYFKEDAELLLVNTGSLSRWKTKKLQCGGTVDCRR
jgi:hypothetical protein